MFKGYNSFLQNLQIQFLFMIMKKGLQWCETTLRQSAFEHRVDILWLADWNLVIFILK